MHPVETIWYNAARVCVCVHACAGISHVCFPVGYACACIHARSRCASKRTLSFFPSAVRVPGSIQHLDQQVSPSCTATLTHSTDLHPPAEGEATQLLTFPRLRIQSHTVLSYCNRVPATFYHVQQFSDAVLVESNLPCSVLLCVCCCIIYSDSVDFIPEDYISPHRLLTDARCPVVAGSVVMQPPEGWLC